MYSEADTGEVSRIETAAERAADTSSPTVFSSAASASSFWLHQSTFISSTSSDSSICFIGVFLGRTYG